MNCSGCGLRDIVRDVRLLTTGAELGDERPDSGRFGDDEPETDALFVRRHSFLMLLTLISDALLVFFAVPLLRPGVGRSSEATESRENRLDGASDKPLDDLLLCACRLLFGGGTSSCIGGTPSRSDGNRPKGSGESGMIGESEAA